MTLEDEAIYGELNSEWYCNLNFAIILLLLLFILLSAVKNKYARVLSNEMFYQYHPERVPHTEVAISEIDRRVRVVGVTSGGKFCKQKFVPVHPVLSSS